MAQVQVYNQEGKKTSKLELADSVFGIEPNEYAMHLAVVSYLANQRQGTQSTLTRSEVSGGGAKPWRQKGTGRARQGSTRSPQWTHGGIALGPKPRKYTVNLNKKVKRLAMKSALSTKVAEGEMMVVNKVEFDGIKTKNVVAMLKGLKAAALLNGNDTTIRQIRTEIIFIPISLLPEFLSVIIKPHTLIIEFLQSISNIFDISIFIQKLLLAQRKNKYFFVCFIKVTF